MNQQTEELNGDTYRSADKSFETYMESLPYETSLHRVKGQSVRCNFGLLRARCQFCANSPCRIVPGGEWGVCGADTNTIVARSFLRTVVCDSGCYIRMVENTAKNLRKVAVVRVKFSSPEAVNRLAGMLGIERKEDFHDMVIEIADTIGENLYHDPEREMNGVERLNLSERYETWRKLGTLPGGAELEVFDSAVEIFTDLSSDAMDMYLHSLRLSISTGVYGSKLTNLMHDILTGEPEIHFALVGFQVTNPDYINTMLTGRQENLFIQFMREAASPASRSIASEAGTKDFRVVNYVYVGLEMQQKRSVYGEVYAGTAGNNSISEAVLATEAIDDVVSELNYTLPRIEMIYSKLEIRQICIDDVAKKKEAVLIPFRYGIANEDVRMILKKVAGRYQCRRKHIKVHFPEYHGNERSSAGSSELSLKKLLGETWKLLIESTIIGRIKGIAGVVGCSSLDGGHDVLVQQLVRELTKQDILVLSAGRTSGGLANCGFTEPRAVDMAGDPLKEVHYSLGILSVLGSDSCLTIGRLEMVAEELAGKLKVDTSQLPLVLPATQWLEGQALADGVYGLALGLTPRLGKPLFVTRGPLAVELFTSQTESLTGGRLILGQDGTAVADRLEEVIIQKRKALNI